MSEKRFTKYVPDSYGYTYITTIIDNEKNKQTGNTDEIVDMLNELADENEKLKSKNRGLQSELQIFKEDITHSNLQINKLADENEKLKKDCSNLIDDNTEYVAEINQMHKENEQLKEEIARQKNTKHIMRENIKSYERAIKRLRKSYEEFDEMRLERIRFLEKRLKRNGLSIYVNDCGDVK